MFSFSFLSHVDGIRKISAYFFLLPSRGRQHVGKEEHGHLRVRILLFFKSTGVARRAYA